MEENKGKNIEEKSLAMELLEELRKTIKTQWIIIGVLIFLLAATNIFHIYQWSQFDTVVVDSGQGGNAGYIGNDGDNNFGGLEDGKSSGSQKEKSERPETKGNED